MSMRLFMASSSFSSSCFLLVRVLVISRSSIFISRLVVREAVARWSSIIRLAVASCRVTLAFGRDELFQISEWNQGALADFHTTKLAGVDQLEERRFAEAGHTHGLSDTQGQRWFGIWSRIAHSDLAAPLMSGRDYQNTFTARKSSDK